MATQRLTRRDAFKAGGAGAAALGLAACGRDDDEPTLSRSKDAPNVLLIITDSTRADYVGAYNSHSLAKTPSLDALAKEALRFTYAVPKAMPTGLVRRTILTGMKGFPCRDWVPSPPLPVQPGWTPILAHQPIVTEVLGEAGVATAYVTDNPFLVGPRYADFRRTLDISLPEFSQAAYRDLNTPFKRLAPRSAIERYLLPRLSDTVEVHRLREYVGWNTLYRSSTRQYSAARVMRGGMAALSDLRDRQPFFLGVDAFDPHEPFDPPRSDFVAEFGSKPIGVEKDGITPIQPFETPASAISDLDIDPDTVRLIQELYASELTFADAWIGRLLNRLDDLGLADNTVVYYLSDHGVSLGEHGIIGKSTPRPFREIHQVPYLIKDPDGRLAGKTSGYYASTHDVTRTILSYMGVRPPGIMDGEDLSVLFDGREPAARPVFTACYQDTLIAGDGRWLLIADKGGQHRRLFDVEADPAADRDLATREPEQLDRLWQALIDEAGGTLPVFGKDGVIGG
jgi:arylsulfatase A-like enzyme